MINIKERISKRMKLIREHHSKAEHALNGGNDAAGAQREMIKAQEQQVEIQNDHFFYFTQPFWDRLSKKEMIVILVVLLGGRDIVIWLKELIVSAKPLLF